MFFEENEKKNLKIGNHKLQCIIPCNFLNYGMYFINLWFGNEEKQFLLAENVGSFKIILPEWEKEKRWAKESRTTRR